jgi:N-formylglutamate amidohydrolase
LHQIRKNLSKGDINLSVRKWPMVDDGHRGFSGYGLDALKLPVLVSVPHAGRHYPDIVFDTLRLPRESLVRLEDRYADLLVRTIVAAGYPVVVAHHARAWIDLNRREDDLDVEMVRGADRAKYPPAGAKQRGGLGLVPRRLSGVGDIWKRQFELADIEQRIASFHRPYHAVISDTLAQMREKFGVAILVDLHSMPPIRSPQIGTPHFVVGDRFGKSAGSQYAELLVEQIRLRGSPAALNHPYSGEHILRQHARPSENVHALQLEIDRSLYLESSLREPGPGLNRTTALVGDLVHALADEALGYATLIAAE